MNNGTSTVILVLAIAVSASVRRTERGIIDALEEGGAITPEKAIPLPLTNALKKLIFRRLLNNGAVGETMDQKQYVDIVAYHAYRKRRITRGLIAAGIVVAVGAALYFFTSRP